MSKLDIDIDAFVRAVEASDNARSVYQALGITRRQYQDTRDRIERDRGIDLPRFKAGRPSKQEEAAKLIIEDQTSKEAIDQSMNASHPDGCFCEACYDNVAVGTFTQPQLAQDQADEDSIINRIKIENTRLKSELNQQLKSSANMDAYKELIHGCLREGVSQPAWLEKKRFTRAGGGTKYLHGAPTLFLSDVHHGERVISDQVGRKNSFSSQISKERLMNCFDTCIHLARDMYRESAYPGIVLPLGGDMCSGIIHDELMQTNDQSLLRCVMDLADTLIAGIEKLQDEFGEVYVPGVVGNHGRLDRKWKAKNGVEDNVDWLLYELIARHFDANSDGSVVIDPSPSFDQIYKVYGVTYLLTHGNQFRGGSGISGPWTPWMLGVKKKQARQVAVGNPFDTMIMGHWHTLSWAQNNLIIVNGSVKGYDEYAFASNFPFEAPKQAMWLTHPNHGIIRKEEIYLAESNQKDTNAAWVSVFGNQLAAKEGQRNNG